MILHILQELSERDVLRKDRNCSYYKIVGRTPIVHTAAALADHDPLIAGNAYATGWANTVKGKGSVCTLKSLTKNADKRQVAYLGVLSWQQVPQVLGACQRHVLHQISYGPSGSALLQARLQRQQAVSRRCECEHCCVISRKPL